MENMKQQVLENYEKRINRHRERIKKESDAGLTPLLPKELQRFSETDLLLMRSKLHPTEHTIGMQCTRDILMFYFEKRVVTLPEIYESLGLSDKTVTKRQQLFKAYGMIYRDGLHYVATPRLDEFVKRYIDSLCAPKKKLSKRAKRGLPELA